MVNKLIATIVMLLLFQLSIHAQEPELPAPSAIAGYDDPFRGSGRADWGASPEASSNELIIIARTALNFYQTFISPQDRPACIFFPSCSQYMKEALSDHGIEGFFMGIDRLQRCHPLNAAHSTLYERTRELKLIDPVQGREVDIKTVR